MRNFMTIWFYVKTNDTPKTVGDVVCAFNVFEDAHPKGKYSWQTVAIKGEPDSWQIMSNYEDIKDLVFVALVYRAGDVVVLGDVDDSFVSNFLDPLLEKYGIDRIRWIVSAPKK